MKTTKETPHLGGVKQVVLVSDKGGKQYCKMGKNLSQLVLHRLDGPAVEYANGYKAHYVNGVKHGVVEFAGKVCSTWENGVRVS